MPDLDWELRELRSAYERSDSILTMHYACENFNEAQDHPPAVSSICLTRIADHGTQAFSPTVLPASAKTEDREVDVLDRFYSALRNVQDAHLVHWNMNGPRYGLEALGSRYRYLTSKPAPYNPPADHVHDLDAILGRRYGDRYANHPKLRFTAALNECNLRYFLGGAEEADLRNKNEFGRIEQSTSEKTRIIAQLFVHLCRGTLRTLTSVGAVDFAEEHIDAVRLILRLGDRLRNVERALKHRHQNRETLFVKDEYDVQDLTRSLLALFFDDVRAEEWTPSYAGGSSRIDFVLPNYRLAIELKFGRATLRAKELGEELIIDRDRYKAREGVRHLICLVFDWDGYIDNPRGLEADLGKDVTEEGMAVTARIYDR